MTLRPRPGRTDREPIAIVGIGCRFPGATDPASFWRLLVEGVDAIREIPRDRFDLDALYDERPAQPGKVNTRWGGFIDGLELFDAEFFGIAPREAERLDPQQRLLLETAWEAVEDAGMLPVDLHGTGTGVFVGMWINEYESRLFRNQSAIDFYMTTGTGRYAASGRLSYHFGLHGPSVTLDTGCSSSLVAVHLACQSLWSGESELALAGAANTIVEPFVTIAYSQSGMMAPDGRCKFGDAAANGYVRSDGAAVVILKPLAKAIADGNPIYATILGSAVTNDGRGSGFMTTPAREGQEEMLRRAYRDAGVSPGQVQYVEAHGTGTRAGDPVELGALGAVLSVDRTAGVPCRVGSVKTNIGHTEGAAGMAGLIKTALSLKHRLIPKNLHFQTPNPEIPWESLPLVVQQTLEPWPSDAPAVAGVSSFGISGTNAHVVLSEGPAVPVETAPPRPALLTISGHSPQALREMAARWQAFIDEGPAAGFVETCARRCRRRRSPSCFQARDRNGRAWAAISTPSSRRSATRWMRATTPSSGTPGGPWCASFSASRTRRRSIASTSYSRPFSPCRCRSRRCGPPGVCAQTRWSDTAWERLRPLASPAGSRSTTRRG
jgi:myxalamid-type polyketide synthase MxaE and MxaD